ncbi:MAG: DUF1080 domain-containing protein [Spirochaetia bacterium]|nr:DUF1080 domain-containing protein [Spirochaetia bacterium]
MNFIVLFLTTLLSTVSILVAADPELAIKGKSLLAVDFKSLPENWKAAKGGWQVKDGVLVGVEKPDDKHAAAIRSAFLFQDAVITFEYKFAGGKALSFSINDEKEHVARLMITPNDFQARKDDHDHGGPDKPSLFQKAELKSGSEWQKVTIALVGNEIWTRVGDKVSFGADDLFKVKKANIGLTVNGEGVAFRNLEIFEATLNPEWAGAREEMKKKYPIAAPAGKPKAAAKDS